MENMTRHILPGHKSITLVLFMHSQIEDPEFQMDRRLCTNLYKRVRKNVDKLPHCNSPGHSQARIL